MLYIRKIITFINNCFTNFKSEKPISSEAVNRLPDLLEPWFIFSLIWSIGATCDNDGRKKFSDFIRETMASLKFKLPIPSEGLVYDYIIDDGGIFSEEENKNDDEPENFRDVSLIIK